MKPSLIISSVIKLTAAVSALWGVSIVCFDSSAFMGGKLSWLYFTVQSNVWIGLTLLLGLVLMLLGRDDRRWYGVLQLVMTVSIMLTGVVFCFVLAPTFGRSAWNLPNILTHVISPIAAVADYLLVCKRFTLRRTDALYALIPPLYYLGFAAVGYVQQWPFNSHGAHYPYFFLDWGSPAGAFGFCDELPYMGVMYYVLIMLVSLSAVALGLIALSKKR